jgi:hypothetical protein
MVMPQLFEQGIRMEKWVDSILSLVSQLHFQVAKFWQIFFSKQKLF